jgi:predicted ATPase
MNCFRWRSLAEDKGTSWWKAFGMMERGWLLALTGKAPGAASLTASGITLFRSIGSTYWLPTFLSYLAMAYAELSQFDDAWRCLREAMTAIETTGETWFEADVYRIAGEVALKSSQSNIANAQAHFERALLVARQQQAKSWELRAAMSLARLWRDQGKVQQARDLLGPVYAWFTEGFATRDLKEAKALLDELS